MRSVNRISSVDVPGDQERALSFAEHLCLMGTGVAPKNGIGIDVIGVVG